MTYIPDTDICIHGDKNTPKQCLRQIIEKLKNLFDGCRSH